MRKTFVALLLLTGVAASSANLALAAMDDMSSPDELKLMNAQMASELRSRAERLGTSAMNTDTTYVGFTPGRFNAANNWWSIYAVLGKDGGHRPYNGTPHSGMWDWETAVNGDSLQGWWPIRNLFTSTGGANLTDNNRPWWANDMGNIANYRPNGNGAKGTFGVNGVWHVDGGSGVGTGSLPRPRFVPSEGAGAAWMGLRAHGDNVYRDKAQGPNAGVPFTEDVMQYASAGSVGGDGSDSGWPGYGSQMDQMLYRDISFQGKKDSALTIRFKYRTVMSLSIGTVATTRTGWFDGDPIAPPELVSGNFISSSAAGDGSAPRDSFMVYVGSGVDGNQWLGSDGLLHDVYDAKRRWFAEVLHYDRAGDGVTPAFYRELLSVAGDNPAGTGGATGDSTSYVTVHRVIPNSILAPLLVKNNKIRLVFRLKSNRGFDDEGTAYSSFRHGAAVVDSVIYQIGSNPPVGFGLFNDPSEINTDANVSALDAWKSTGKPPAIYHHVHKFDPPISLEYDDLCGQKGDVSRQCDMSGTIISGGNHEDSERPQSQVDRTTEREQLEGIVSPTVQLADDDGNPATRNPHGLFGIGGNGGVGDAFAGEDIYVDYDLYAGIMDPFTKGSLWQFGFQSYPATAKSAPGQGNGYPHWGNLQFPGFIIFNPDQQCFRDLEGGNVNSLIRTSNANGIPDSIRIYLRKFTSCFRFGVSLGCAPDDGVYWDNASMTMIDGTAIVSSVDIWQWYNDAFPASERVGAPGNPALFDTTSALVKTGLNVAQSPNNPTRFDVPGDSISIGSRAGTQRMDMVFRVLPGPGNYNPIGQAHCRGNPQIKMREVPARPQLIQVNASGGSFWEVYTRNPGEFSSPNAGTQLDTACTGWDPNVWVSARCDTAEGNLYAFQGRGILGGPASPFNWMSTYHESDAKFTLIGPTKFKCFVRCSSCALSDIICDGTVPAYLPGGTSATTREGNKIIPDGILAPGAHVEYFFRSQIASKTPGAMAGMVPDTNKVSPQLSEGPSTDGHRWQQFGVLPDRWKQSGFHHPVLGPRTKGPACLLVIDNNDRRGNERVWVSVADTIGATQQEKWGAHNGWHAIGNTDDINNAANNRRSDGSAGYTSRHGGQPGTTWDMYQVKASESLTTSAGSIGSRLAFRGGESKVAVKSSRQGPTPEMLGAYYTLILFMSGDLNAGTLGPFSNRSQNDAGILSNWLQAGNVVDSLKNRGIWAIGDGFVEDNATYLDGGPQDQLMSVGFRTKLVNANYFAFTGDHAPTNDLTVYPEWQGKKAGEIKVYGMRNLCFWTNDIIEPTTPLLTSVTSEYKKKGNPSGGPYYAGVYKDHDTGSPWKALVDGWDIEHLTTRNDPNTYNRHAYFLKVFTNVWSNIWTVAGTPLVPLDVPTFDDGGLANFVNLANNPLKSGSASFQLGLAAADRVQISVYDVSGRLVRTLADRMFEAGPHTIVWDGLDRAGNEVPRGVYFTQVKYARQGYLANKKLIVLK